MSKNFGSMICHINETGTKFSFGNKEHSPSEQSISSIVKIVSKHAESSLRIMEEYLDKQQLTDVILIAGNKRIPAHRLVLSAGSEYFAAMFTGFLKESKENEIELVDVDGDALSSLVRYCYTGCIELKEDSVQTLLATAHLLQLHPVVKACCKFLRKQLHSSNCLGIRMFADMHGCLDLLKEAHAYTTEYFMEVIKNQEFLLCSADQVAELLESNDLNVPSEDSIFHALMAWLKYDLPNRKKDASKLLSLVKLPLLSPAFIADHIESNEIFKDQKAAQELIIEALKYHLLPERRPLLQSNRTKPRKATVGHLLAVGGMDANEGSTLSIYSFSLRENSWNSVATMWGKRLQFGAAVVDRKLIIAGGRDGLKTLNTVECLDFFPHVWYTLPPMNFHRHGLGVAVLGGPLYAVGGHDGWSFLDTVERWDPHTKQWHIIAPMSIQRSTVGVAALNDKYDPKTDTWTMVAPMSVARDAVGVCVLGDKLMAVGGYDGQQYLTLVEAYDPHLNKWEPVTPLPTGRGGPCVVIENSL
ncbi:PREDICTED: kelch-like protein 5 isoform X2 [Polistes dominula]|uniref:Kelch-like protein diablo n=1 Tax=Polistes dominula TaxID=743375 RepID=A0ABM1HXJ9_POLDO|nr:PREDICTED: kelch-like protein 5 isoform X2 [Polistes dominula]